MKDRQMSKEVSMKKTSLKLPEELWKRLRIRSIEEGRDAQTIVAELIEQYLRKKGGSHGSR